MCSSDFPYCSRTRLHLAITTLYWEDSAKISIRSMGSLSSCTARKEEAPLRMHFVKFWTAINLSPDFSASLNFCASSRPKDRREEAMVSTLKGETVAIGSTVMEVKHAS